MRWLALHLPRLSLEAFCATLPPAERGRPVALLHGHQVVAVCAEAARRGLRPGMKRATALALAADLLPASADAARDSAALQAVVHAALAFTPMVTLETALPGPPTVLLELQSSLRLFGGWPRLLQRLQAALAPLGHALQCAAAPTPLAAALLAREAGRFTGGPETDAAATAPAALGAAPGAPAIDLLHGPHLSQPARLAALLARLPPQALAAGAAQHEALQAMGLARLGELQRLPRAGLARRLGPALLEEWDRALGRRPDPRRPLVPPPVFESRLELHTRAEHTEPLLAAAAVLLARLLAWAQGRQVRLRAFTLAMRHERGLRADDVPRAPTRLRVELAEPSLDTAHLQVLLRERLARCRLPAPTLELELHCDEVAAGGPATAELFPTRQAEAEGLLRLLERLRARLGADAVCQLQPLADHRPEHAQREVPAQGHLPAAEKTRGRGGAAGRRAGAADSTMGRADRGGAAPPPLPLHRPVWLLPDPLPLTERDGQPWLAGQPLQLLLGPERIETGWWDEAPAELAARDYYIAAAPGVGRGDGGNDNADAGAGALVWIWRRRLPGPEGSLSWFLQGRFG
jgi:protein ImuB